MKAPIRFFLVSLLLRSLCVPAQHNPDCSHLEVTSLSASSQPGKLHVSITNQCDDCASGVNGCVYWEMRVIRITAPFDTIAASKCNCLQTPNNNSSRTYTLYMPGSLPPADSLRISFTCGQEGCDTLTYSTVNLTTTGGRKHGTLYPNPSSGYITLSDLDRRIHKVIITNAAGLNVKTITIERSKTTFDAGAFRPGSYFVTGYDRKGNAFPSLRFVKE